MAYFCSGAHKVFGLIDCNNFYVSCERVFRPDWRANPPSCSPTMTDARWPVPPIIVESVASSICRLFKLELGISRDQAVWSMGPLQICTAAIQEYAEGVGAETR